jgi:hypothetical protein
MEVCTRALLLLEREKGKEFGNPTMEINSKAYTPMI